MAEFIPNVQIVAKQINRSVKEMQNHPADWTKMRARFGETVVVGWVMPQMKDMPEYMPEYITLALEEKAERFPSPYIPLNTAAGWKFEVID